MNETNKNLTDLEIRRLSRAKSEDQWNSICDDIKGARGGVYPDDWWQRVQVSGLAASTAALWTS